MLKSRLSFLDRVTEAALSLAYATTTNYGVC
jgi:hypothetical protein